MVYINQNIEKHLIRDTVDFISIESGINLLKKLKRRISGGPAMGTITRKLSGLDVMFNCGRCWVSPYLLM